MKISEFISGVGRPISFFPALARCFGREESLFLCYLITWKKDTESWVFRTLQEIETDTSLSPREQRRIRANLCDCGLLEVKKDPETSRLFYKLDEDLLHKKWLE